MEEKVSGTISPSDEVAKWLRQPQTIGRRCEPLIVEAFGLDAARQWRVIDVFWRFSTVTGRFQQDGAKITPKSRCSD